MFAVEEGSIPSDRKLGGVLMVATRAPRTFRAIWVGQAEESDEHLVVNEPGHVIRVRAVRRCVDNEDNGQDVCKLTTTPSYLKPDANDDVDVQEKWTPTDDCKACESGSTMRST